MAELADLLADALSNVSDIESEWEDLSEAEFEELSREERAELLPLSARQALAGEIAAERGIKRASAMRLMQRYVAGTRRPDQAVLSYLGSLVAAVDLSDTGDWRAVITGWIRVSEELRRRTVRATIPADAMRPVIRAHLAGQHDRAADLFASAFRDAYAGVELEFENLESVELDPS